MVDTLAVTTVLTSPETFAQPSKNWPVMISDGCVLDSKKAIRPCNLGAIYENLHPDEDC